jgi:hypothetical protein
MRFDFDLQWMAAAAVAVERLVARLSEKSEGKAIASC